MCKIECEDAKKQALNFVVQKNNSDSKRLISILQGAQEIYGYLPVEVIYDLAAQLGISPAKIMGVASFYAQFRLEPVGRYVIMLCKGTACHVNGADKIEAAIKNELKIEVGHTTEDGLFTLKTVACLGCCSLSPVMMINDQAFGSLTAEKAVDILRKFRIENCSQQAAAGQGED